MKNLIIYNYDIIIDDFSYNDNKKIGVINSKGIIYVVKEVKNIENFEKTIKYLDNTYYYSIVLTKMKKYYFDFDNSFYLMFKLNKNIDNKVENIKPQIIYTDEIINNLMIWENNIEYYSKISSNDIKTEAISYYYIGLAETALSIYNRFLKINSPARISISHFRIKYPNYELYYKDPTELTIDYISRDIAEYIKSKFFFNNISFDEIFKIIQKLNLNDREILYLIARLFYPNYYFESNDKELILNKQQDYEILLKELLSKIKTTNLKINIDWLS